MPGLWSLRVWWARHRRERSFLPPPVTVSVGSAVGGFFTVTHRREWARADHTGKVFETGVIVGDFFVEDGRPRVDRWLVKVTR
jgi:hypothetical protein